MTHTLRLDIYEALEERSYRTVQDLALRLDSGTPAPQAQVRAVLFGEPETFYQMEDWWDLAIFHRFADQSNAFRGRGGRAFDEAKFLSRVLAEALRLKARPIHLKTFAEKYLPKIAKSAGIRSDAFPRRRWEALDRLRGFLGQHSEFHLLTADGDEYIWRAVEWPEDAAVVAAPPPDYRLPDDFLDRAADFLSQRRGRPVRLADLLKSLMAIGASDLNFPTAFAQANSALSADDETFVQVQEQAWMLVADLPDTIADIPARVAIPRWRNPAEEQLIVELYDQWPVESLAEAAAFAGQDTEDEAIAQFDESFLTAVKFILPYHWRQNGVLKMNSRERRLFPDRPARVYLEFTDQTGQVFPVWLNNDTGYLQGLREWFAAYLVPTGGVFYLQRSSGSHYKFTTARWIPIPISKKTGCVIWRRCGPKSRLPRRPSRTSCATCSRAARPMRRCTTGRSGRRCM